ncbi:MAG: AAA family ATPase [Chloroflexi bacterium]|nr:AAA family ATPase [Chloroflexota bacterium]
MSLRIHLLSALTVTGENGRSIDIGSPTARSLFAYLVLNHRHSIDRRRLAFLFWPRGSEQAARRNLRQYLHRIRQSLEVVDPDGRLLSTQGHHIRFVPPPNWSLDVAEFEAVCTSPDEDFPQAVQLYTGDLLEDLYDDWVMEERERLARLYRQTLLKLIDQHETVRKYEEALPYARTYLAAEPLLENAYLRLMRLYYAAGDRARLSQTYQQLGQMLEQELGVSPLPETEAVYEAMLAGNYPLQNTQSLSPGFAISSSPKKPTAPVVQSVSPFVGRETEMQWLDKGFTAVTQSTGRACFLLGESGVGKSRLLDEWVQQFNQPAYIFRGRGHEFEAMIPYSPIAHALREADQTSLPWDYFQPPPPWLGSLIPLLPNLQTHFPGHTFANQHHVIEGMGNFLLTLAQRQPVILIMDNLHWVDMPTWNFLGYLAQHAVHAQLLIIAAARPEDIPLDRQRLIRKMERKQWQIRHLQRLTRIETEELVRQLMPGGAIDPVFVRRIFEETEGNPFFIIETIRAVREAGGDWTDSVPTDAAGQRPQFAIPLQVQAVIESRLDKLDEKSNSALGVAAAIGRAFTFELLQEVSQLAPQELLDALDVWLARGIVSETREGYDFTHEKLSQVAYQRLSRARRQWMHRQIADYLAVHQIEVDPAQMAHHYYRSTKPEKALSYLALAGQRALRVRSYDEAREFGLQAIGLLGRFPGVTKTSRQERIDLNLQLARAYAFTGQLKKATQLLQETERMAEMSDDAGRMAQIFYQSAQLFWLQSRPQMANDYARRLLRHAEEIDESELRMAALRMLGRTNIVLSQYDDAIAFLLRYIDIAEQEIAPPDLPVVLGYLGVSYARVGSWQRAIDAAQRGLDLAPPDMPGSMHVVARMQLAFVYADLREWEQGQQIAAPIMNLPQQVGMSPHLFMLRAVYGRCQAHLQENPQQGVAEIQAALQWSDEVGYRVMGHVVQLYLAQAQFFAGDYDVARHTAVQAMQLAQASGDLWAEAVAVRTRAEISMRQTLPDWLQTESDLIHARDILRDIRARPDLARTYLTMRRLYDRAGQIAWAVDCHFRATTIFEELGMGMEKREAQGHAARDRTGAVVIPEMALRGPNLAEANLD